MLFNLYRSAHYTHDMSPPGPLYNAGSLSRGKDNFMLRLRRRTAFFPFLCLFFIVSFHPHSPPPILYKIDTELIKSSKKKTNFHSYNNAKCMVTHRLFPISIMGATNNSMLKKAQMKMTNIQSFKNI